MSLDAIHAASKKLYEQAANAVLPSAKFLGNEVKGAGQTISDEFFGKLFSLIAFHNAGP
jgi:hypothetical protein